MPTTEEIRSSQRAAWAGLAPDWEKWDAVIQQQLGPVGATMIEDLDLTDVRHHLDVASGTEEPGLTVAARLPHARAVLTDLSAELARVLRPGGRLSASVWADAAQNPWTTLALDAIAAETPLPPRDPDAPGMFRCTVGTA